MIERNVDYLQMNVHLTETSLYRAGILPVPPVRFYKRGFSDEIGVRYYYGNPKSNKALIVLSGQALETARGRVLSDSDILERYLSMGATCTRIDLAVTDYIENDFCTVDDVKSWVRLGRVTSTWVGQGAVSLSKMTEDFSDRLETFYVGNMAQRGKKGIFRAYDKGIQSGLDESIITRLEAEIRSDKANSVAKRLAKDGDIAGNFRASFDARSEQFERLMDAPAIVPVRGLGQAKIDESERMMKRWDWLINQVAPALDEAVKWEKKNNPQTPQLMKFLVEAGLMDEVRQFATDLAERKYQDKLHNNELISVREYDAKEAKNGSR